MEQKRRWAVPAPLQSLAAWKLPPLILHPFAGEKGPDRLLEGSKAQLALHGLLPSFKGNRETLHRLILEGRYQEMKMLIYIGRDLHRWAEQCLDFAMREPGLRDQSLKEQSFITLLVESPPKGFAAKLKNWGISDQKAIFSRAMGLKSLFDQPPGMEALECGFVSSYQRYADYFFMCYQSLDKFRKLDPARFIFELYASDEYASLLADGWKS